MSEANPDIKAALALNPQSEIAVDKLSAAQFRHIEDPVFAIPEKGLRVRKRKRRSHQTHKEVKSPQWDAAAESGAGEQESGDEKQEGWRELTTATTAVEVRRDGAVIQTRKRFKKKRLPTVVEKAFVRLGHAARMVLIAFGGIVFLGAVAGGIYLSRSRDTAPAPPTWPQEIEDRAFARIDETLEAESVVRQFLAADGLEAKLPFVRFPDKVRPIMEEWYKIHDAGPTRGERTIELEPLTKIIRAGDMTFTVIALQLQSTQEIRFYAVEQTAGGGKLDWETAVSYQPMLLDQFKQLRPTDPVPFRVVASSGDYYNGIFADEQRWLCCDLSYPGDPEFHLFGYVDLSTVPGRRLAEKIVEDSASVSVILSLTYLPKVTDPNQVIITSIVNEEWFLTDGPLLKNMAR
ncbi:MAG: hypothetical protein ACR2OZ_03785 [Verrucomicrobiales bacterium]